MLPRIRFAFFDWVVVVLWVIIACIIVIFHSNPLVLSTLLVLQLGIILPLWWDYDILTMRMTIAKETETAKWGYASLDTDGPWVISTTHAVMYRAPITIDMYFYSEWLIIHNGVIIVNPGKSEIVDGVINYDFQTRTEYSWDGCTPKRWWLRYKIIGTPDISNTTEAISTIDGPVPITWPLSSRASLLHDALCQYMHLHPVPSKHTDTLFRQLLTTNAPIHAIVYYMGVRLGAVIGRVKKQSPSHTLVLSEDTASFLNKLT